MNTIAYSSPFIPVEWIAAHGLRPHWLRLRAADSRPLAATVRGVCPYAGAVVDAALSGIDAAGLVLTTICDQMRYAAALAGSRGNCPVFLLNVPSTWQTEAARKLYLDELRRLGRFLVRLGGRSPADADLTQVMLAYDGARRAVRAARERLSARQFAEALAELRGPAPEISGPADGSPQTGGIALVILGGPLLEADYALFDLVEQAGGRVVLDATEGGERTLPAPFDPARVISAPLGELARAYFDDIPDAFRRPNDKLYEWLGRELTARQVRGIVFRRYVWCDLWHAELQRLKTWSPVPVLELDAGPDDTSAQNRSQGRIEAFLEMLGSREEMSPTIS